MDISLELYKIFYTVAKNQSFSKAAQELFISQSAVSQAIKNLEKSLGFPLLVRTTKQVSTTIDGEILMAHLEQAFNILKNAQDKLKIRQDKFSGQLVFASTDTLCKYVLLPKIQKMSEKYPSIKIKIINGTSVECMKLLRDSKVDFALMNIPKNMDTKFKIEKKYSFKDVFIASNKSSIKDELSLEEISKHSLMVLDKNSVTRNFLDNIFLKHKINLNPDVELQNIDLLVDMAQMNLGISFVPDICIKNRAVKVIKTHEKIPKRQYAIVSLKNMPTTPAAHTFLDSL